LTGQREQLEASILPLRRVGEPEDIASATAFLLSNDAAYITGATLPVDGGRLIIGGESVDLIGKCDASELADHFASIQQAQAAT
jgi:NAD(P)-dependent dehydrogenase (short-subunit alcohol dehydrogenase family)